MPPFVRAQLDYYAVLEIDRSADTAEINAAFRRLAWRFHPDRNPAPEATLQFQDINEAHQVLFDPVRRAQYDAEWHPADGDRRRSSRRSSRVRYRRVYRRRRTYRAGVLAVCAFVFLTSAWILIFAAMGSGRYVAASETYEAPLSLGTAASSDCNFSLEMFPVTYTDEHGRQSTGWETDVRNCWGGLTKLSSVPADRQHRASRFLDDSSYRWFEPR